MRRLAVVALVLSALTVGGAAAVEVAANGSATATPGSDGSACFELRLGGPFAGVATASGLVRTGPIVYPEIRHRMTGPTEHFTDYETFSTLNDHLEVCVGGVGRLVESGVAVFTVNAHSASSDVTVVLTCKYGRAGPSCT